MSFTKHCGSDFHIVSCVHSFVLMTISCDKVAKWDRQVQRIDLSVFDESVIEFTLVSGTRCEIVGPINDSRDSAGH